jgi:hypothetical protein
VFVELADFWRIGDGPIAVMTLHCDESDDGQTYALAGWLAVPSGWDRFDPAWRAMLKTIPMPDGSECRAFHAAEIVGRDLISDSKFKGWSFTDEVNVFDKAISVIEDKTTAALLWPVGVALQVPSTFEWIQRDSIWLMLFAKLFTAIRKTYPDQRSISMMFDEKKAIHSNALVIHSAAKSAFNTLVGEEYIRAIGFDSDESVIPLQAADLLAYEWRKRISDETDRPGKAVRKSYARIRAARPDGALWRYGRSLYDEAMKIDPVTGDQSLSYYRWFMERDPTHND